MNDGGLLKGVGGEEIGGPIFYCRVGLKKGFELYG